MSESPTPDYRRTPAEIAADILLDIEAVHIRPQEPFTFTSGRLSPVYVDCRKIISFPRARARLMDMAVDLLGQQAGFEQFDAVAGGETAGIPFAAWIAERLSLPMLYIRKKPKGFGRNARIEGALAPGQRVLLVEDLATDGGSKLSFIDAVREAEGRDRPLPGGFPLRQFSAKHPIPGRPRGGVAWSVHLVGCVGRRRTARGRRRRYRPGPPVFK